MQQLTDENFYTKVREEVGPVVIFFSDSSVQSCQEFKPTFEELSKQMKNVKFMIADLDDVPQITSDYNVCTVPLLAIFIDGMIREITFGTKQKANLRLWIQDSI